MFIREKRERRKLRKAKKIVDEAGWSAPRKKKEKEEKKTKELLRHHRMVEYIVLPTRTDQRSQGFSLGAEKGSGGPS